MLLARKLTMPMISVAVLDGSFLLVALIFFAGLAVKSWVAYKREQMEEQERAESEGDADALDS